MKATFTQSDSHDFILLIPDTAEEAKDLERWSGCLISSAFYQPHQTIRPHGQLLICREI